MVSNYWMLRPPTTDLFGFRGAKLLGGGIGDGLERGRAITCQGLITNVQRLGWECEFNPKSLGQAQNVQHQFMSSTQFIGPRLTVKEHVQQHVQAGVAKAVELDIAHVLPGVRSVHDECFHPTAKRFHLFGACSVAQAKSCFEPSVVAFAVVIDDSGGRQSAFGMLTAEL